MAQYCIRCGEPREDPSDPKQRCLGCIANDAKKKVQASKPYHQARYRAWRRLEKAHQAEFKGYMTEELAAARSPSAATPT